MQARLITEITVDEYLEAEDGADLRHEYVCGEVFAPAGGSVAHSITGANVMRLLGNAASGSSYRVHSSDMKLRVEEQLLYYPDVMVVCEAPADDYYETSPYVVVEVLSDSTVSKDRLEERFAYASLPSLELYLLVDSRKREVTGCYREEAGWDERRFAEGDAVPTYGTGTSLNFGELYDKTFF